MVQQSSHAIDEQEGGGEKGHGHDGHEGHGHHGHAGHNPLKASAHATFHCLIGCYIGDAIGITAGVYFGLGTAASIGLAVVCAYVAGFSLAVIPIMRSMDFTFRKAMRVVWLGEAISIAAMEIAINGVDFLVGGVQAGSITDPVFWIGLAAAAPAGFFAAWPVNHWLLKKEIKAH